MTELLPQQFSSFNDYQKAVRQRWLAERLNKKRQEKEMNKYYWTCPECGANLDPNEKCDCKCKLATKNDAPLIKRNYEHPEIYIRKEAKK